MLSAVRCHPTDHPNGGGETLAASLLVRGVMGGLHPRISGGFFNAHFSCSSVRLLMSALGKRRVSFLVPAACATAELTATLSRPRVERPQVDPGQPSSSAATAGDDKGEPRSPDLRSRIAMYLTGPRTFPDR